MDGECPRQADALLHAAAQLIGIVVFETGESNETYVVLHSFDKLPSGHAVDFESEGDVIHHCLPRQ